jgi:hypothetical protein
MSQSCRIEPAQVFQSFKRGNTFSFVYGVPDSYGGNIETVESTVTNNRDFSLDFTVTELGLIESYYRWKILATPEQTATFPLNQQLRFDIKKTYADGTEQQTETFFLPITEGETQ